MEFILNKKSPKVQTETYWAPANCQGITISYDVEEPLSMGLILLVYDPRMRLRFQKQLGHSGKKISIGKTSETTTIGGIPGKTPEGLWTVKLVWHKKWILAKRPKLDTKVRLELDFHESVLAENMEGPAWVDKNFAYVNYEVGQVYHKGEAWYKGDFHTHTQLSDGKELPKSVSQKCLEDGLDFYVATEHNMLHTGWCYTKLMVVPGIEITTDLGHANLFGLTERPESLDDIIFAEKKHEQKKALKKVIKECKKKGVLLSINHPFLYEWKWLYRGLKLKRVSCLEIVNDPTYAAIPEGHADEANAKAMLLSDFLWSQGYRICAIGGSDSHMLKGECYEGAKYPSTPGDPATWVKMDHLSPEHLLEGLRSCHAYATRFCQVEASLHAADKNGKKLNSCSFGDILPEDCAVLVYNIKITTDRKPRLYYLKNWARTDILTVKTGENTYEASGIIGIYSGKYTWIRFGATDEEDQFLFYANPVTKGSRKTEIRTFGQAEDMISEM